MNPYKYIRVFKYNNSNRKYVLFHLGSIVVQLVFMQVNPYCFFCKQLYVSTEPLIVVNRQLINQTKTKQANKQTPTTSLSI